MKKLILSLAMLVGSSSVLPLVASAESMYQDIMGSIVNASLVKNDQERLEKLNNALSSVREEKHDAEWRIVRLHGRFNNSADLTLATIMTTLTVALPFVNVKAKLGEALVLSTLSGIFTIGFLARQQIDCYFAKNKLAEFNEVIAKLEAAKAELENKIATEQQEQDVTPVEQQA